jgi:Holliday junction resolvasome RuvABC endonuclease subunit
MLVLGIDVALTKTGLAAIEDSRAVRWLTINVEGDAEDTGPRFAKLREAIELVSVRILKKKSPAVVVIERPEHGLREGRGAGAIMKLYGSFAVAYAECARLWPKAQLVGVEPMRWKGNLSKELWGRMMRAKYPNADCANNDEVDALGLANYGWDLALAKERAEQKLLDNG